MAGPGGSAARSGGSAAPGRVGNHTKPYYKLTFADVQVVTPATRPVGYGTLMFLAGGRRPRVDPPASAASLGGERDSPITLPRAAKHQIPMCLSRHRE